MNNPPGVANLGNKNRRGAVPDRYLLGYAGRLVPDLIPYTLYMPPLYGPLTLPLQIKVVSPKRTFSRSLISNSQEESTRMADGHVVQAHREHMDTAPSVGVREQTLLRPPSHATSPASDPRRVLVTDEDVCPGRDPTYQGEAQAKKMEKDRVRERNLALKRAKTSWWKGKEVTEGKLAKLAALETQMAAQATQQKARADAVLASALAAQQILFAEKMRELETQNNKQKLENKELEKTANANIAKVIQLEDEIRDGPQQQQQRARRSEANHSSLNSAASCGKCADSSRKDKKATETNAALRLENTRLLKMIGSREKEQSLLWDLRQHKTRSRMLGDQMTAMVGQHEAAISAAKQEVSDYYKQELDRYGSLIHQYKAPLQTHRVVDGNNTREWDLVFWRQSMKSMMRTTAQVTTDLWEYAMEYMEETSAAMRSKQWKAPSEKNLKELRTDAALVDQICAGVDVAKARWLLTFFIDETELECSSLQSMMRECATLH